MSVIYTYYHHHHAKQNYYTKLAMIKKSYYILWCRLLYVCVDGIYLTEKIMWFEIQMLFLGAILGTLFLPISFKTS